MKCCISITSFWHIIIDPTSPVTVKVPKYADLNITNASLGPSKLIPEEKFPKSGRIILYASVNEGTNENDSIEHSIVPFTIGSLESTMISMKLCEDTVCVFRTSGADVPIHLCGYMFSSYGTNNIQVEGAGEGLLSAEEYQKRLAEVEGDEDKRCAD